MGRLRRAARAGGIFACSALALLLWSKLKLVSGIPRSAYATPEAAAEEGRRIDPPAPEPAQHAVVTVDQDDLP